MHRFFIPPAWITGDTVSLKEDTARQIINVLRLKPGEHIVVLDNSGMEYEMEISSVSDHIVHGDVVRHSPCGGEPSLNITLCQALLKTDKFELVLQKGVELGVHTIVPFLSERCVVKAPSESRIQRWERIMREAAEQCGRAYIPALKAVTSFGDACKSAGKTAMIFWEEERKTTLKSLIQEPPYSEARNLSVIVGPEGGFPASEVYFASSLGIPSVSLGKRAVRAETAAIAAVSMILYEKGELG